MSRCFSKDEDKGLYHSLHESVNPQSNQRNADDESSVDIDGEQSSSLPQENGLGNVEIDNLFDESSDGSVSLFLDSANSSVNMRQNESDDDNNGGVLLEQSHGISQELTSLLYRDVAIPQYNIPKPYHWDNHPEPLSRLGSEDEEDDEEQQTSSTQLEQGRDESTPFVNAHPSSGRSVPSRTREASERDKRMVRRFFVTNRRARVEPQSLVADSPIEFGRSKQLFKDDDGPATTLEQFHDEPYSLNYARSVSSKKNNGNNRGGLEALPDDEDDPNSEVNKNSRDGKKHSLFEMTGQEIGLLLCILGLLIVISTGIMILINMIRNQSHVQVVQSSLTVPPTPAPSGMPTRVSSVAPTIPRPTITFPPSGRLTLNVEVLNDEYINLGGLILRSVHVQHTTTLLVGDGVNRSAAISIIEFDSAATVGPLSGIVPWLVSATIQLTLADQLEFEVDDVIRLYVKPYPNAIANNPQRDINDYASGQIHFHDGWIPLDIIPNQTETVDIDVTNFFQRQFPPSRTHQTLEDNNNVIVMLAHDNSVHNASQGSSVRFYSSESASPSQHPRLILVLQAPNFSLSPAPATTPIPKSSSKPSPTPSVYPSLHPSASFDPSYHPTLSPEPIIQSYPSCSICGGLIFANSNSSIAGVENLGNVSSSETTCGIMQEKALNGTLSPKECQQIQSQVGKTCCHPIDNSSFVCDLCGGNHTANEGSVVNLDAEVSVPGFGEVQSCRYYQERAKAGMVSSAQCETVQPYTALTCCGILL